MRQEPTMIDRRMPYSVLLLKTYHKKAVFRVNQVFQNPAVLKAQKTINQRNKNSFLKKIKEKKQENKTIKKRALMKQREVIFYNKGFRG